MNLQPKKALISQSNRKCRNNFTSTGPKVPREDTGPLASTIGNPPTLPTEGPNTAAYKHKPRASYPGAVPAIIILYVYMYSFTTRASYCNREVHTL